MSLRAAGRTNLLQHSTFASSRVTSNRRTAGNPATRAISGSSRRQHSAAARHARIARPSARSSLTYTTLALALTLTLSGAFLVATRYSSNPSDLTLTTSPQKSPISSDDLDLVSLLGMPDSIPPGRPGNLTPEQEAKLRDLWALTLRVCGVVDPAAASETASTTTPDAQSTTTDTSAGNASKQKKGKMGMFKRKPKKGEAEASDAATTTAGSGAATTTPADVLSGLDEKDDKHGLVKTFKETMSQQTPDDLRNALWSMVKHDHPDGLLLRFLRARKWDVNAALVMMISTLHWRLKDAHVDDDIMLHGEAAALAETKSGDAAVKKEGGDFLTQLRMGKSFLHNTDKEGRPLCFVRVRLHRQGEQSEKSLERFTVYTIETARMILQPPVDTATIVFDMTGFSMANMDYTPVKFMIKCFEANYPESLGAVLVHKAPWIFQGIWSIIRGWLDPVVAGKVHFTKTSDDLAAFISKANIPKELGGEEDWEYRYIEPVEGENEAMKDTATRDSLLAARKELVQKYEDVLLEWVDHEDVTGKSGARDAAARDLRDNYWKLDPYLRARSLYDRSGMLKVETVAGQDVNDITSKMQKVVVETNHDDVD